MSTSEQTRTSTITSTIMATAAHRYAFVDLTDAVVEAVGRSRVSDGICVVFCCHTTCGLLINEWEDGAQEDLLRRLDVLVPDAIYYAHDDLDRRTQNLVAEERANGRAHVLQMLLGGNSQVVPVAGSTLLLGRWQRLFMLELDEPKERSIVIQVVGAMDTASPSLSRLEACTLEPSR